MKTSDSQDRHRWTANLDHLPERVIRYDSFVVLNEAKVGVRRYLFAS